MIQLRKLKYDDIEGMLEWMNDESIIRNFRFNGKKKTSDEIKQFIDNSFSKANQHFAIVDSDDKYLGTISLKNIDEMNKCAEYAICLRNQAIGSGIAKKATEKLLQYAKQELHLQKIYLNIYEDNIRANKFYQKIGFQEEGKSLDALYINGIYKNLNWYSKILNDDQCPLFQQVRLQRNVDEHGELTVFEGDKKIPFDIKRLFYIKNVRKGEIRGKHANKKSEFIMICLKGSVKIRVTDGCNEKIICMDEKSDALYIPKMIWKDMYDFNNDCILLVLSNEYYDKDEYIRDYGEYEKWMGENNAMN